MPEPTDGHDHTWARSRRRRPRLRHALALMIALVVGSVGVGTTASAAPICTYDVPTPSCVGVLANEVAEAGVLHTADSRERPAMSAAYALGTSTTPVAPVVATNTAGDVIGAVCSFSAETRVLMADDTTKPISEVLVGDAVLAYDPETGERGPRKVTHLWVHHDTLLDLEVDESSVTTTEDHPFWNVTDQAWQPAAELDTGDLVLTAGGGTASVDSLDWSTRFAGTAYNLTVDGIHTYYVAVGDDEVLVHNQCPVPGNPFTGPTAPQRAFEHLDDFHGLDPHVASNRLHTIKQQAGLSAADDVIIGRSGDVYEATTGEWLGTLTDPGLGG